MRILAVDGGGIRGIFAAYLLQLIEEDCRKPIAELFDLIAGTSTGAIIAAAIVQRKPLQEMALFYELEGKNVFRQRSLGLFRTIYDIQQLQEILEPQMGHIPLKEIQKPLLIPSVDLKRCQPFVFRSGALQLLNEESEHELNKKATLLDAVLSSCSAPIYFSPHEVNAKLLATDGGLWANNPSLVCIQDALRILKIPLEKISILSIGSGIQNISFQQKETRWGIPKWIHIKLFPFRIIPTLIDLTLHLTSEAISSQCETLLGERYLRLNAPLQKEIPLDDIHSVEKLKQLAEEVYVKQIGKIKRWI